MFSPTTPRVALITAMALCVIEPLILGVVFDAQQLNDVGALGSVVASASHVLRFAFATLAVFVAIVALRRDVRLAVVTPLLEQARLRMAPLLIHAGTLLPLFFLSRRLFGASAIHTGAVTPLGVAGWLVCVIAAAGSLALSVLSWRQWRHLLGVARHMLFVSLCVGAVAVVLGLLADRLWTTLGGVTLRAVLLVLDRFEPEVLVSEAKSVIGTPRFVVEIAPECSGFEGMGLAVVFIGVLVIGAWHAMHVARVVAFLPVLLVLVWALNAVRIAALVWWGTHVSADVALGAFHSKAGWVLFCLVGLASVAVLRSSAFFSRDVERAVASNKGTDPRDPESKNTESENAESEKTESYNPVVVYCLPFGLQLLTGMTTGAFVAHVDWLYGLRVVAIAAGLYGSWRLLPRLVPSAWGFAVATGVVAFGAWMVFEPSPDLPAIALARAEFENAPFAQRTLWLTARCVGSILLIPIAEELAFRGFLLRRLVDANFEEVPFTRWAPWSVLLTSLVFGALHANWIGGVVCGVLFAYAMKRRGALGDAIVAHAVANLLVAVAALGFGRWELWF